MNVATAERALERAERRLDRAQSDSEYRRILKEVRLCEDRLLDAQQREADQLERSSRRGWF